MTKRQTMVYDFIRAYIAIHAFAPSYEDIASGMGLKSRSNVHRLVHQLRKQGLLPVRARKFRTLQIVDRSALAMAAL